MTQVSLIRNESREKGVKRTLKLPVINAGITKQYTKDHAKLRNVIMEFGYFNQISIMNNGAIDIEVALDFIEGKTYPVPGNSSIFVDEIMFQSFNVTNTDAGPTVADKVMIICGFERPLIRDKMKTKKMMLGGR